MDEAAVDLERLVLKPEETLEVEYKEWLNLKSKPHKAKLAKELIALRNHGGGHLVLGFEDNNMEAVARPTGYDYVTTDYVNGIVARYAQPAFHCHVRTVKEHLIISVPAGVKEPVRSRRGSKDDEIMPNRYYIRRPGPNSEPPRSGLEWDVLLRRCIGNRQAELETTVRRVLRALTRPTKDLPLERTDPIDELLR